MDAPTTHMHLDKKLGPLPRKAWLGIVVVGVIGGLWWRSRSSSAATAAAAPTTPPTNPNIDPATGQTWASEAQQAAAASGPYGGGSTGSGTSTGVDPSIDPNTGVPWAAEVGAGSTNAPSPSTVINVTVPAKHHTKHTSHGHGSRKHGGHTMHHRNGPPAKTHHTAHHPTPHHRRKGHHGR